MAGNLFAKASGDSLKIPHHQPQAGNGPGGL